MTSYRVDDRDSGISYSKPLSGGHWTENGSSDSYEGTVTFTRTRNANATVTFTGTSISVYGVVSKSGTGNTQSSRYSVDGAYTSTYVASPTSSVQNQVLFYNSGTLPNAQHTLLLVNLVELDYLWIDYFFITQAAATSGSVTTVVQQAPAVVATTTNKVVVAPSPSTLVVTEVLTSTTVDGSSTKLSVVTTTKSEVVQITAGVSGTVSLDSQASSTGLGSANAGIESTGKNQAPIGAIVGGVVGGIAVIILLIILFVILRRKGRRNSDSPEGMSNRSGGASGSLWALQSDHPSVVPFAGSRPPPTVSSSAYTQSSTNPPSTLAQGGEFNQAYMAGGNTGASFGATGDLHSVEMGKRQYMAENISNAQHQREIEQDQNRANPASPSDGSTQYSEPLSTHPLLPADDSPPSYYQLHTPAGLGATGERIVADLANTRKS